MEEKGFDSQPRSTRTTEEVEYTGPSHKKDHKDDLCKLLSIVWTEDGIIPIALFRESCKPQSEWSWDGELHERRSALWTFPPWLEASLARFEDGSTSNQQWKGCHIENMVFGKGIVIGKECKNINLSGIPYEEQHFNILTIALQALPDQYSEVLWQAKEDQLWDVIETTCLPFLWDIHDLRRWISMSSLPHIPYLLHLTKFLVRVRNRNRHSLRTTCPAEHAQEILQILRRETSHYEKADLNYLELAADLCEILSARRRPPLEMLEDVKKLAFDRKDILDRRMVSEIGFTLFDIAKTKHGTGAAMQSWDISWWFSLIQKHPSTMECIAMSLNLPDDALINRLQDWHLNIDAKAVIGMIATTKESHSEAIRILDTAIPDVKARYGVQSIETLVVATALVISCNILLQHDVAERWARVILGQSSRSEKSSADTQHADLEWAKRIVKGETAPARFVHLLTALADFFTSRESYAAAESLLERVITIDTRIKPKTRMITYLMILGMYEKRGDRMEEPKTWKYLQQAVKILKYVPLEQQDKCLEETVRIFLSLDRYNRANLQRAGEILHSLFLATRLRCRNVQRGRLREIAERLNILCLCGSPMMLGQKILDLFPQAHPRIIERISEVSWARGVHIYCSHPSSSSRYIDIDVQSRGFEEPALRPSWTSNPRSLATLLETVQRRCPICKNRFPVGMTKAQKEHHIMLDLSPYICPFPDCWQGSACHSSKSTYAAHLFQHLTSVVYTCCRCKTSYTRSDNLAYHLRCYYGVKEPTVDLDYHVIHPPRNAKMMKCPLCFEILDITAFLEHICHHMETVAMSCVPDIKHTRWIPYLGIINTGPGVPNPPPPMPAVDDFAPSIFEFMTERNPSPQIDPQGALPPVPRLNTDIRPPGDSTPTQEDRVEIYCDDWCVDARYKRPRNTQRFFRVGKVFSIVRRDSSWNNAIKDITRATPEMRVHSYIQRLIVVREQNDCCWCVPITTYGGKGVVQAGVDPSKHAVLFVRGSIPYTSPEEPPMGKSPIEIIPSIPIREMLMFRVNFGRVHTIEHNATVLDIGDVSRESLPTLLDHFKEELVYSGLHYRSSDFSARTLLKYWRRKD